MRGQHPLKPETLAAKFASERHSSRVYPMVFFQRSPFSELPTAYVASVRFQAGMNGTVFAQAHYRFKRFPANVAVVRSDGRVGQQMVV